MRQSRLFLTVMAAALLTACGQDDYSEPTINVTTLIDDTSPTGGTRAASDILNSAFESGDQFNLYIVDNGNTNTKIADNVAKSTGSNVSTGYYYPANGHTVDIYGIYPSSVKYATTSFSVNATQDMTSTGKTNYKASDLMLASLTNCARQDGAHTLTFTHQLSKIIVQIKRDASLANTETATVILNNVKLGATISHGAFSAVSGNASTVSMGQVTLSSTDSYQTLAAIIPPQKVPASGTAATSLITVTLGSGGSYTYSTTAGTAASFAKSNAYTYTITVGLKGIKVTTSITNWTAPAANTTAIGSVTI